MAFDPLAQGAYCVGGQHQPLCAAAGRHAVIRLQMHRARAHEGPPKLSFLSNRLGANTWVRLPDRVAHFLQRNSKKGCRLLAMGYRWLWAIGCREHPMNRLKSKTCAVAQTNGLSRCPIFVELREEDNERVELAQLRQPINPTPFMNSRKVHWPGTPTEFATLRFHTRRVTSPLFFRIEGFPNRRLSESKVFRIEGFPNRGSS